MYLSHCAVQLDGRSMALESGRYMETVGWLSAKLDRKGSTKNVTFSRRYLDPNRVTYQVGDLLRTLPKLFFANFTSLSSTPRRTIEPLTHLWESLLPRVSINLLRRLIWMPLLELHQMISCSAGTRHASSWV